VSESKIPQFYAMFTINYGCEQQFLNCTVAASFPPTIINQFWWL